MSRQLELLTVKSNKGSRGSRYENAHLVDGVVGGIEGSIFIEGAGFEGK